MLAQNDNCGLFHHCDREWNTLADELTYRARETGASWGSDEGRPAPIRVFFDGGVNFAGECKQGDRFLAGAGWVLQTSDTRETGTPSGKRGWNNAVLCHNEPQSRQLK